jgi:WD40 repeat protein
MSLCIRKGDAMIRQFCKGPRQKAPLVGFVVWFAGAALLRHLLPYQPRFTLPATEDRIVAGFSPDGKILATKLNKRIRSSAPGLKRAEDNGPIRVWDVDRGEEIGNFSTNGRFADAVEFSSDGAIMLIDTLSPDCSERVLLVIDRKAGRELARVPAEPETRQAHLTADGRTLVFNPPEHQHGPPKLWDIPAGREKLTLDSWPACFSPDGQWFVSMESEGELRVRSGATGLSTSVISNVGRQLNWFVISPDGSMLACDVYTATKVWDPAIGKELASLPRAWNPRFSRSGKRLAARCPDVRGTIKIWDTTNWQEIVEFNYEPVSNSNVSLILAGPGPEDFRLATLGNHGVAPPSTVEWIARHLGMRGIGRARMLNDLKVFDITSGKELADFSAEGKIQVSPDGRAFAVDSDSIPYYPPWEDIRIFDIPPRRPLHHIILWPLPIALLAIMIAWLIGYRKAPRNPQAGQS